MARQAWRDSFFMAADGTKSAEEWLLALPSKPAAEAISGIYEVRCRQGDQLHRLFCLLDRNHPGGPALVVLDGESKPYRTAMP